MTPDDIRQRRRARISAGSIGGYAGFLFGLLCVLSVASELANPLPMGEAAVTVLVCMCIGYTIGWLIHPLIESLFPQP